MPWAYTPPPSMYDVARMDSFGGGIHSTNWVDIVEAREWLRNVGYAYLRRSSNSCTPMTRAAYNAHLATFEQQWLELDCGPDGDPRVRRNDRFEWFKEQNEKDVKRVLIVTAPCVEWSQDAVKRMDGDRNALRQIHTLIVNDDRCPPNDHERLELLREEIEQNDDQLKRLDGLVTTLTNKLARARSLGVIVNAKGD